MPGVHTSQCVDSYIWKEPGVASNASVCIAYPVLSRAEASLTRSRRWNVEGRTNGSPMKYNRMDYLVIRVRERNTARVCNIIILNVNVKFFHVVDHSRVTCAKQG